MDLKTIYHAAMLSVPQLLQLNKGERESKRCMITSNQLFSRILMRELTEPLTKIE